MFCIKGVARVRTARAHSVCRLAGVVFLWSCVVVESVWSASFRSLYCLRTQLARGLGFAFKWAGQTYVARAVLARRPPALRPQRPVPGSPAHPLCLVTIQRRILGWPLSRDVRLQDNAFLLPVGICPERGG